MSEMYEKQLCEKCGCVLWSEKKDTVIEIHGEIILSRAPEIICPKCGYRQLLDVNWWIRTERGSWIDGGT